MGNDFTRGILSVSLAIFAIVFPIYAFETSFFLDQNNAVTTTLCNSTVTEDCDRNVNGDSHSSKRLLQGGPTYNRRRHICYGAIQKPGVCNGNIYGNCIVPIGPSYRPCTVYTRCKRGVR
ncbi:hypothetical protein ERO13_D07G084900v2 [Gossypium hirsutum]|uniref:Protein RALF-like 27 n=2 Tax=Gossypium TaxID=3633 RepID=A0ABM3ACY8_GOSHI|nr:protein RALF-like 27 [Gossypium hirsutum]KAG4137655.1 hypothetical protein ERO13_D07G084900v2 [Gossypium hirsutum]TYH62078.1 hypothetical protein ES332_D07G093900v1 [Gossypium tomentosum]